MLVGFGDTSKYITECK